jgi:ABC-type polysaccharide/polyol phosphate export permease
LSGLIEAFRHSLVPTATFNWNHLWLSLGATVVLVVLGMTYFRRTEKAFADIV